MRKTIFIMLGIMSMILLCGMIYAASIKSKNLEKLGGVEIPPVQVGNSSYEQPELDTYPNGVGAIRITVHSGDNSIQGIRLLTREEMQLIQGNQAAYNAAVEKLIGETIGKGMEVKPLPPETTKPQGIFDPQNIQQYIP